MSGISYWQFKTCKGVLINIFRITADEFQDIIKMKDADGDGFISFKEFLERKEPSSKKSDLAFEILDK